MSPSEVSRRTDMYVTFCHAVSRIHCLRQACNSHTMGWHRISEFIERESTFFRIHVISFTVLPLVFAAIFYASNTRFHVPFIDAMFLCYSAMTVTGEYLLVSDPNNVESHPGLSTVNLSAVTSWQQIILFILMGVVRMYNFHTSSFRLNCFL